MLQGRRITMPASGSLMDQVQSSSFYAEDDRVSVPRIIQIGTGSQTVSNVFTNDDQTPTVLSEVQLFPIR
jgi:hypothetical protein